MSCLPQKLAVSESASALGIDDFEGRDRRYRLARLLARGPPQGERNQRPSRAVFGLYYFFLQQFSTEGVALMRNVRFAVAFAAALLVSVVVYGDTVGVTAIGPPIPGNSWSQVFSASGVGNFDFLGVVMTSAPDRLEPPAFVGLTSGWLPGNVVSNNAHAAYATGSVVSSLSWQSNFTGSQNDALAVDFYLYDSSTLTYSAHAAWTGGGINGVWIISPPASLSMSRQAIVDAADLAPGPAVPTPAAASMGLTLMSVVGGLTYLRKRKVA
jgi:hypothetical protein